MYVVLLVYWNSIVWSHCASGMHACICVWHCMYVCVYMYRTARQLVVHLWCTLHAYMRRCICFIMKFIIAFMHTWLHAYILHSNTYTWMHIVPHTYIHTCTHAARMRWEWVYMYIYTHIYIRAVSKMSPRLHTHGYTYIHIHMHPECAVRRMGLHVCIYVYIYIYIHIYIYIYTYIRAVSRMTMQWKHTYIHTAEIPK